VALTLICTLPLLFMRKLNDRHALLALFSANYFVQFALLDYLQLFSGGAVYVRQAPVLSEAEGVILVGAVMVQLCFLLVSSTPRRQSSKPIADWPPELLLYGGLALWLAGTWLSWVYKVDIMVAPTAAATRQGFATLNSLQILGFMIAAYLQPLSIAMLAYAYCRQRRPLLVPVLIVAVLAQLAIGFVSDSKSDALLGVVLVAVTRLLLEGRLPRLWIVGAVVFIGGVYPVLTANRAVRSEYGLTHVDAAQQIGQVVSRALETNKTEAKNEDEKRQAIYERLSLKGSVDMIVSRTGHGVAFQNGNTLESLLTVFIPRILWSDKPDLQVGRLVTAQFLGSESPDLYTSPSHVGELYWNFGWPGVVIGMGLIGLLLGYVGVRTDLSAGINLTRVLIIMVTIQQLIIGSESTFAAPYTVWLRSLLAIGLAHWLIARPGAGAQSDVAPQTVPQAAQGGWRFENLMH